MVFPFVMRRMVSLGVFIFCLALFAQRSAAGEVEDLKKQMILMRQQMEAMSQRIGQLEAEKGKGLTKTSKPEGIEERVAFIEKKLEQPWENGLLSLKGKKWEIGGKLELEFVDTESDDAILDPEPYFQLDKFTLISNVELSEDISFYGQVNFKNSSLVTKKAYMKWAHLPGETFLKAGLDKPLIDMKRKTETHTLNATAFGFRDSDLGLYGGGSFPGFFYWRGSVTNGFQLTTKGIGEDNSYKVIHESDDTNDNNTNKEVGMGLGINTEFLNTGKLDVLGFGYWGKLSVEDLAFLQAIPGYGTSDEDKKYKAGVNGIYAFKDFTLLTQYIHAVDGEMGRDGWFIQPSYKWKIFGWKYAGTHEFIFRYNNLDIGIDKNFSSPETWDRTTYTLGVITDIVENVKLKTEYNINAEKTGQEDVNNNELLMQLEITF